MADVQGPVLPPNQNQNPNQKPNQVPDQNPSPNQNPPSPLNPFVPNAPLALEVPQRPQLNWSHFKPKYAGKPDKDAEAHLLRTNDWMDTHEFPDQVKVQRFCLTLVGEARLWYESLRLINENWVGLQNIFRQQYSNIGNGITISCMEVISLQQKCRNNRCLCKPYKTGCNTFRLSRSANTRSFQKHPSNEIILGSLSHNGSKTSGRDSKKNINERKGR